MNIQTALCASSAAVCASLAVFVFLRDSPSWVRRFLALGMLSLSAESVAAACALAGQAGAVVPVPCLRARLLAMAFVPGSWMLFSLTFARGNYRDFLRRWRLPVVLSFCLPVALAVLPPHRLLHAADAARALSPVYRLTHAGSALHVLYLLGLVAALMQLERTLRASVGTMRWRIKYMVIGIGVMFGVRIYTTSQALVYSSVNLAMEGLNAASAILGSGLVAFSLFRSPLRRVDLYPSHTFLCRSLTLLLAGTYLLLVGGLARLVTGVGLPLEDFPLNTFLIFVALVGLAVLAMSDRLRQEIKRFVSRHLARPPYDYRRLWEEFSARTARATDSRSFCRTVAELVSETFHALSVTAWVLDENRQHLLCGGSTTLSPGGTADAIGPIPFSREVSCRLMSQTEPVDMDASPEAWIAPLRDAAPRQFEKGGHRFCVPLASGGQLVGVLTVGDRVAGEPFTGDDLDLMETVANHVAAHLLNARLSERLLDAKQMEAFQVMSAFFIHDLKNTASTLSLMTDNLPRHFDDPGFRTDAVKAISRSVGKINDLIRRLGVLRQKLTVNAAPSDLNALVRSVTKDLAARPGATLTSALQDVPPVRLDAEQFAKVVANLVLNALDAVGTGGRVEVATARSGSTVILSVSDNGSGMDPEFMAEGLFRPFRSTKKDGMGIGLFHSKMIVDAHGGSIEVSSRRGEGSTFRVFLPVAGGTGEIASARG